MKLKGDFVTNSSTTSYIMSVSADIYEGGDPQCQFHFSSIRDKSVRDILDIVEESIKRLCYDDMDYDVILNVSIDDFCCDGWDGGDFYFAGNGGAFYGSSDLTTLIMTKEDVELRYNGKTKKIEGYPEGWEVQGKIWLEDLLKEKGLEETARLMEFDDAKSMKERIICSLHDRSMSEIYEYFPELGITEEELNEMEEDE